MARTLSKDTPAVYRIKLTRRYEETDWREAFEQVSYLGPYTTLGAARNQAARLKNYRYGNTDEADIEFARTEWESADQ